MTKLGCREASHHPRDAYGCSFSSQLSKVVDTAITEAQEQMTFRNDLRLLLPPILTAKGIKT